jgi:signal transduction histidine kinase
MPDERRRRGHSLGIAGAAIILGLGAVVALVGWYVVRRQTEREAARETALYASTLAAVVEGHVRRLERAVRRRAEIWGPSNAPNLPAESRAQLAELFLTEHPAILALGDGSREVAVVGSDEGRALAKDLLALADREGEPAHDRFLGPVTASDGRPVLGLQIRPASGAGGRTVLAAIDPQIVLHQVLAERALGYGLGVSIDGRSVYRRSPADATSLAELAQTASVTLDEGHSWTLSVWPTATGAFASAARGTLLALAAGLLASSVLVLALHYGGLAWRRQSALRLANAELERTIAETRRGETDLKRLSLELEARVEQRTAELGETILELEAFYFSVSHDLRGPLGAVINFAAILREECEGRIDEPALEHLSRIERSAATAVSRMDALLTYSRSGQLELHKTDLDMRRLVADVSRELAAASPELAGAVKVGDLPRCHADEDIMRFVIKSLLENSRKFARPGETPRVEVGGSESATEVSYFVRDEGVGFDMRFAEKLFTLFERLHARDEYEGHGVSLAIVARMVRRHGGRVSAQAAVGKGATFAFSLPLRNGRDGRDTSA